MHSINNVSNEIVINKSRFIASLFFVQNKDDVNKYLEETKAQYKDATHYCYAYIINNSVQASDDNEPSGTAGKPILNVLEKNDLNYCLCIVTRYFGGIKLGSGGLVRAYTKATTECLNKTAFIPLKKGYLIEFTTDFKYTKKLENLINNITNKIFTETVTYTFEVTIDKFNEIKEDLNNIGKINIIKEIEVKDE